MLLAEKLQNFTSNYHSWLIFQILLHPTIGFDTEFGHQWVLSLMSIKQLKNGVLAVQMIRNNIMASTLLAMTSITLSSLIGVFVSSTSDPRKSAARLVYGNKSSYCGP
ncbi:hypothetical protein MLD38_026226 [Melastoma candidum]|uniref:Uncharacterized protein n=1 Tax=Melastoma candidum TaxID=119954 RepID=A0ACB9NYY0_9MYRT|nr:hypothetical protein MLD38_026226 [Melastoma candidum]